MERVSSEVEPAQPQRGMRPLSTSNRIGLVMAGVLGLIDLPTALYDPPEGFVSPDRAVLIVASVCGAVTLVGVLLCCWPRYRPMARVVVAARLISMLLGLAAFIVSPVETSVKGFAIASVPATLATVYLMYRTPLRGGAGNRDETQEGTAAG